jgi:divalent metal cation (Fe/Co/Zn/Cd) transporter
MVAALEPDRRSLVRRGRRLEYFTIAWNGLEAFVSILAGLAAASTSLLAFGLDSLIEVASGAALLWRLHHEFHPTRREAVERATHRTVGACFLALSAYVAFESASALLRREAPEQSIPGIAIAAAAVVVMPLLARAKRRIAAGIASGAMHSDARQADFCMYLSAILLAGLLLNAALGWWWADPAAGLVMVPIIAREGIAALRGQPCCDNCHGG